MLACLRPVEFQNQVGEAVDDCRLLIEAGSGIDHTEDAQPGRHAVQIAQFAFQVAQNRQRHQARRLVALL